MSTRVDQLIEVVTIASGSQWFIDLLISVRCPLPPDVVVLETHKRPLYQLLNKEAKESSKPIHAICKLMVSCIVERIFAVDEQNPDQTTQQVCTWRY
jgi:hypothetical protein